MNKDFSELVEYLDEKFINIDNKFADIDTKLESKASQNSLDELRNAVDAYAQKADTYFQEMVMLSHKVDKIEKWVLQMADKLGMKLQY